MQRGTTETPTERKGALGALNAHCLNLIKKIITPVLNLPNDIFRRESRNATKSLHIVHKARKTMLAPGEPNDLHYVKEVNPDKKPDNFMPQLESIISYFYELLMERPESVARTCAHYDTEKKTGFVYDTVSSREIPNFKSASEDPLREENLKVERINNGMSIEDFDREEIKIRNTATYREYRKSEKKTDPKKIFIFSTPLSDVLNYQMLKGLAIGLTTSFIMEEDDTSRNNMSKYGERLDFDMSLWPILYFYKEAISRIDWIFRQTIDWAFRKPAPGQYKFTPKNIIRFPILEEAEPFYWPTKKPPVIPEPYRSFLVNNNLLSSNSFEPNDNEIYNKLATNPVFIFHKFKTLLKFILTDPEMYKQIAFLHSDENCKLPYHENKSIADALKDHLDERIKEAKQVLFNLPAFQKFIKEQGDIAFSMIMEEWKERNQRYQPLQESIKKLYNKPNEPTTRNIILPLDTIRERYEDIKRKTAAMAALHNGEATRFFPRAGLIVQDDYPDIMPDKKDELRPPTP